MIPSRLQVSEPASREASSLACAMLPARRSRRGPSRLAAVPILFGRALQNPYQGFAVYTVKQGDTLSSIAQEFYGDPQRFRTIFHANRNILDDPDEVFPGQELRIPQ